MVFMTLVGTKETLYPFLLYGSVLLMYYDIVAGDEAGKNAAVSMLSNKAGRLEAYCLNSE